MKPPYWQYMLLRALLVSVHFMPVHDIVCYSLPYTQLIFELLNSACIFSITLTKEFNAQTLRLVRLMYVEEGELEKDIGFRSIKNLSEFKGFTIIKAVKTDFSLGFDDADNRTRKL